MNFSRGSDDHLKWLEGVEYRQEYGEENAKLEAAAALHSARESAQATQAQLAELAGVSQAYIAKLERGDANPTIGNLGRILSCLWLKPVIKAVNLITDTASYAVFDVTHRQSSDYEHEDWVNWTLQGTTGNQPKDVEVSVVLIP